MHIYEDNSLTIGHTPLVKLNRVVPEAAQGATILAKIESRNPANSVKCRIGANMIWEAEQSGVLTAGKKIVEPTSGNTGIALAYVAAARGYPLTLTMPSSMSLERRKILKALGANLVLTEPAKGMQGAVDKAQEIADGDSNFVLLQQFENPANPDIHFKTTGPEIWQDTEGRVDIFVAGVGTGGTISGVSKYIKDTQGKAIESIAVEPEASDIIKQSLNGQTIKPAPHKIQGIGANFIPKNLDMDLVDDAVSVSNEDAIAMAQRLMKEEGILAGISSGAAVVGAIEVAKRPENQGKMIVVILPDSGERYLSTALFDGIFTELELQQ